MTAPTLPRLETDQTDFDAVAHEYDDSLPSHVVEHYLEKRLAYITRHMSGQPGRALDLGCGTGVFAERAREAGWDVVAVDPFRGMLEQAPLLPVPRFPPCT